MSENKQQLKRELGVFGAMMMGLGSIVGTGVFISIGIAAGIAGPAVVLAVVLAAMVAVCNGMSSAQLAASHPVSGGTYEYGYKYLNPSLGFTAGWMFLTAKSASAATASLGFAGYALTTFGLSHSYMVPLALAIVLIFTVIILTGVRRTNTVNIVIVSITLLTLIVFVLTGLPRVFARGATNMQPFFAGEKGASWPLAALFHATALMFVAYTGYGRIATLGEEVREPRKTIPLAIIAVMSVTALLYVAVASVAIGSVGLETIVKATVEDAAPLAVASSHFNLPLLPALMTIGAVTAMLGVLLNLILGLSRVMLAMGRRGDMPAATGKLNKSQTTPTVAIVVVAVIIAGLVLIGNVKTTWTFSAFTVLIYYALTNQAALRLPPEHRLYPRWISAAGLTSCLFLAFWVDWRTWCTGLGIIALGHVWRLIMRLANKSSGLGHFSH